MQNFMMEKMIKVDRVIEELSLVNLDEKIDYKTFNDGIQSVGQIMINGDYWNNKELFHFSDVLEIDVFTAMEQICDKNQLKIKILDFDYKIIDDTLLMHIKLSIDGYKEVGKTFLSTDVYVPEETKKEIVETINVTESKKEVKDENFEILVDQTSRNTIVVDEVIEPVKKEKKVEMKGKEEGKTSFINDLFKSLNENVICFTYRVILKNDSYETIAKEENVNVDELKKLNKDCELFLGNLIKLPK